MSSSGSEAMNTPTVFQTTLGIVLLSACATIQAKVPTCANPVGKWKDQLQSVLEIKTYDPATGAIMGQYIPHAGAGAHLMVGWTNSAPAETDDTCKYCKSNRVQVITFAVRWGSMESVRSWTGTCGVNRQSGVEQIFALFNATRPDTQFAWDHTFTGAEPFVPSE